MVLLWKVFVVFILMNVGVSFDRFVVCVGVVYGDM